MSFNELAFFSHCLCQNFSLLLGLHDQAPTLHFDVKVFWLQTLDDLQMHFTAFAPDFRLCLLYVSKPHLGGVWLRRGRSEGKEAWEGVGAEPPGSVHSSLPIPRALYSSVGLFSGEFTLLRCGDSPQGSLHSPVWADRCRAHNPKCAEYPWGRWVRGHPSVHSPGGVACTSQPSFSRAQSLNSWSKLGYILQ